MKFEHRFRRPYQRIEQGEMPNSLLALRQSPYEVARFDELGYARDRYELILDFWLGQARLTWIGDWYVKSENP